MTIADRLNSQAAIQKILKVRTALNVTPTASYHCGSDLSGPEQYRFRRTGTMFIA
jgi:hypothetical protein